MFEEINISDDLNNLMIIKSSIYYLFDNYLNENIGSTYETRNYITHKCDINTLFLLNNKYIIDFPNPTHSTIIYKLIIKDDTTNTERVYMYYSNSGFGINNQIYEYDKFVVPKLYYIKNPDIYDLIIKYILTIYKTLIYDYNDSSFLHKLTEYYDKIVKKETIIDFLNRRINIIESEYKIKLRYILRKKYNINYDNDDIIKIIDSITLKLDSHEDENKLMSIHDSNKNIQDLIYAIFNLAILKFNQHDENKSDGFIQECTINHVLLGMDDKIIKDTLEKLSIKTENNSDSLTDFLNNTNETTLMGSYNHLINKKLLLYSDSFNTSNEILLRFKNIIEKINIKLKEYAEHSKILKFKLHMFKLDYDFSYGIKNYIQKSGSCTFYSYYNLGINNLLLQLFLNKSLKNEQIIDKFVETFLYIHYMYLNLLKYNLSLLPKFIETTALHISENTFYHNFY